LFTPVRIVVEAIDMANQQQLAIPRHGPDAWNVYRQAHPDSKVDLCQADLRRAILEETDLRDSDLTGANLAAARLAGSDLTGANITIARLTGADLLLASVRGGDLDAADLVGANLEGADLRGANRKGALLVGANLPRAAYSTEDKVVRWTGRCGPMCATATSIVDSRFT
jgi:hypothetical protein